MLAITKALLNTGYNVVVLDSLENGHREAVDHRAILEICNLKDKEKVRQIFGKYSFSAVIDFAAYLAVGESMENPAKYIENNVFNFINLLEVIKSSDCKLIIKSSTASTYGNPLKDSDFPLKESYTENFKPKKSSLLPGAWQGQELSGEDLFQKVLEFYNKGIVDHSSLSLNDDEITKLRIPTSIYGLTKLLDEILMKKYDKSSGIKYITLRYFNVAGADSSGETGEDKPNPTNLMTVALYSALGRMNKLKVFGHDYPTPDGTGIRDYIHVSDLADGHVKALEYLLNNRKSDTFNLGNGKGYSVLEVIKSAEKAIAHPIEFEYAPRRSGDPAISYSDPSRANNVLGWQAKYTIEDMARTAWKWHSSHPDGYGKH